MSYKQKVPAFFWLVEQLRKECWGQTLSGCVYAQSDILSEYRLSKVAVFDSFLWLISAHPKAH
jgi:hypothetical protein